jgi:hypothetical protein
MWTAAASVRREQLIRVRDLRGNRGREGHTQGQRWQCLPAIQPSAPFHDSRCIYTSINWAVMVAEGLIWSALTAELGSIAEPGPASCPSAACRTTASKEEDVEEDVRCK